MVHEIIKNRFSTRAFSNKEIDDEKILALFEAARWSPSSLNEQPWRFIAGLKDKNGTFNMISGLLHPNNRVWAVNAPLLILTIAKLNIKSSHLINKHALHDLGLAIANLTFQASAMHLYVHQMGGFDQDEAKAVFSIPENFDPVTILAVGYKGDPDLLPENLKLRELSKRKRKDLSEIVFSEKFGLPSDLIKTGENAILMERN
jgi:nitroreductase